MRHSAGTCHLPIIIGSVPGRSLRFRGSDPSENGRTIYADQVHENGSHLEYEVGEDSYAIPKSVVERVDAGGVRPERVSTDSKDVPSFTPADNLKGEPEVSDKIIRDGKVDADALAAIEQQGNAPVTAAAYFIAGKHEMEQTNFSKARTYFETALRFEGQNPTILNYYVALLLRTGNAVEALPYAERAGANCPRFTRHAGHPGLCPVCQRSQ